MIKDYQSKGRAILATAAPIESAAPKTKRAKAKPAAAPADELQALRAQLDEARADHARMMAQRDAHAESQAQLAAELEQARLTIERIKRAPAALEELQALRAQLQESADECQELRQALQDARRALQLANDDVRAGDTARAEVYAELGQAREELQALWAQLEAAESGALADTRDNVRIESELARQRDEARIEARGLADAFQALQIQAQDAFTGMMEALQARDEALAQLQALQARPAAAAAPMMRPIQAAAPAVRIESAALTVKIHAAGPMPAALRLELEAAGFRWSDRRTGFYWAPASDAALQAAQSIAGRLALAS